MLIQKQLIFSCLSPEITLVVVNNIRVNKMIFRNSLPQQNNICIQTMFALFLIPKMVHNKKTSLKHHNSTTKKPTSLKYILLPNRLHYQK